MSAPPPLISRIYRITCPDGSYYYGSTSYKYLSARIYAHKRDSLRPGNAKNRLYTHIKANGGWDAVKIEEMEILEGGSKTDIRIKENAYILQHEGNPKCLNHNRAYVTPEEKVTRNRECQKRWKQAQKERLNSVVTCQCGLEHTVGRTAQHLTSTRHFESLGRRLTGKSPDTPQDSDALSHPPTS